MPRVMIRGWTRKTPDTDPGEEADQRRDRQRDEDGNRQALASDERRHDESGHRGDRADGEVDAPGQHRQRLAAGDDRQRDGGPERSPREVGAEDAGPREPPE